MKKTFLLLFAVVSLVATAQPDYRPMLCEGRVWNEHTGSGLGSWGQALDPLSTISGCVLCYIYK